MGRRHLRKIIPVAAALMRSRGSFVRQLGGWDDMRLFSVNRMVKHS
jgi:hypothetical protein